MSLTNAYPEWISPRPSRSDDGFGPDRVTSQYRPRRHPLSPGVRVTLTDSLSTVPVEIVMLGVPPSSRLPFLTIKGEPYQTVHRCVRLP